MPDRHHHGASRPQDAMAWEANADQGRHARRLAQDVAVHARHRRPRGDLLMGSGHQGGASPQQLVPRASGPYRRCRGFRRDRRRDGRDGAQPWWARRACRNCALHGRPRPRRPRGRPGIGRARPRASALRQLSSDAVQRGRGDKHARGIALRLARFRGGRPRARGLQPPGRGLRWSAHHVPAPVIRGGLPQAMK
jgi:hypothetical protein